MPDETFDLSGKEDADMRKRRLAVVSKLRDCGRALGETRLVGLAADGAPLQQTGTLTRAADAVESCCMRPVAFYLFDDAAKNRMERARCRHRLCPHCRNVVAAHVGSALTDLVSAELEARNRLAMLTLPIKHSRRHTLKQVRKAQGKAWGLLTKRAFWKLFVSEYHRVAEVEFNHQHGFNAHFHALIRVGPFTRERQEPKPGKKRGWYKTTPLRKPDLMDLFRNDRLRKLKAYQWWARRERRQGRTPTEAGFLSIRATDIQKMFVEEWQIVTGKLGSQHASFVLSYQEIRPGKTPGTVLKRWKDSRTGEQKSEERTVAKFTCELTKYVTKGHATGAKKRKGQVGFHEFPPLVMADYLRGLKNWHLHQSSSGWSKIQQAFEEAEAGDEQMAAHDDGCRRVPYVALVKDLQDAVGGEHGKPGSETFESTLRDGLAVLPMMRTAAGEGHFDKRILIALESHLARLLGSDDPVERFPLVLHEKIALARLDGREYRPGMSAKEAAELRIEALADIEAATIGWDPEVEAQHAAMLQGAAS